MTGGLGVLLTVLASSVERKGQWKEGRMEAGWSELQELGARKMWLVLLFYQQFGFSRPFRKDLRIGVLSFAQSSYLRTQLVLTKNIFNGCILGGGRGDLKKKCYLGTAHLRTNPDPSALG